MAGLQQVRGHACAHVSQPDKSNLHAVHDALYSYLPQGSGRVDRAAIVEQVACRMGQVKGELVRLEGDAFVLEALEERLV
jgi:hypothetical protein